MTQLTLNHGICSQSFSELFDPTNSEAERRNRWARWVRAMRNESDNTRECLAIWMDAAACCENGRCRQLRGRCWCNVQGLPATVNPVLSFRAGMPGMACMGFGPD